MKTLHRVAASGIRHFMRADIPVVAEMYRQVFLSKAAPDQSAQAVQAAFAEIFFDNPWYDEELSSLVALDAAGQVAGFLGVTARPMRFRGRAVRAAVSAHFMIAPGGKSQLAGLQLLKTFFSGPQDFSLTDGANHVGRKVWEGVGGVTVPGYSFRWARFLRPTAYALSSAAQKISLLSSLRFATNPFCRLSDSYLARLMPHRFALPTTHAEPAPLNVEVLSAGLTECSAGAALHPDYDLGELTWLLNRAARIRQFGDLQQVAVRNAQGELLGWYLYYLQTQGESRVLQIAARRNAFPEVFDHLCRYAWQQGAVVLTGRIEPKHLPFFAERHCSFSSGNPWLQVHSHQADLLQAILSGDAFLTGLEGEWCTSFRGV